MKKIITLILTAAMILSMASCAVIRPVKEDVTGTIDTKEPEKEETTAEPEETTEEPEDTTEEPEETTAEPDDEETVSDDIIGENSGITYQNKYFNNMIVLNEEWTLKTEEEIRELNEQAMGALPGNYAEKMKKADYFYDMMATAFDGLVSMNVVIQNMSNLPGAALLTESMIVASTVDTLADSYKNMGYTDVVVNQEKFTFCGEEHDGLILTAKINGIDTFVKEVAIMKGSYFESITVFSMTEDITGDLLAMFTTIE